MQTPTEIQGPICRAKVTIYSSARFYLVLIQREVRTKMNNAIRMTHCVCILLVLGLVAGCGDDNPSNVNPPDHTNLGGTIGVYADMNGVSPNVVDNGNLAEIYVVHKVAEGATACAFKIEQPAGWTLISAESQFPVSIGNIEDGISIGYGQCRSGSIHVMTLTYNAPGNSTPDARFRVLPNPQWPEHVQVVDCDQNLVDDGIGVESPIVLPQETGAGHQGRPKTRED